MFVWSCIQEFASLESETAKLSRLGRNITCEQPQMKVWNILSFIAAHRLTVNNLVRSYV
jgi:hypothetical protein